MNTVAIQLVTSRRMNLPCEVEEKHRHATSKAKVRSVNVYVANVNFANVYHVDLNFAVRHPTYHVYW